MTITVPVRVSVPNIADILTRYDRIMVWRAPEEDESISVEITTATTRPVLQPGQSKYLYTDTTASLTDWYQTSFLNTATGEQSPKGPLRSAQGDYTLDVVSVQELKENFLAGIPMTTPDGKMIPDSAFRYWIKAAVGALERRLDIPLRELHVTEERHEYCAQDYYQLNRIKLFKRPLLAVSRLQIVSLANGSKADVPIAWVRSRLTAASFQVVPTSGIPSTSYIATGGPTWFSSINQFLGWLPGVFEVDYTAGFKKGDVPPELKRLAGLMAAIDPLMVIGDLIGGVGVAGGRIGLDDLMTDTRSTKSSKGGAFAGRVQTYRDEIEHLIKVFEIKFGGVSWIVS